MLLLDVDRTRFYSKTARCTTLNILTIRQGGLQATLCSNLPEPDRYHTGLGRALFGPSTLNLHQGYPTTQAGTRALLYYRDLYLPTIVRHHCHSPSRH